jgi:acyl-CoA reductase-like NAD-dependent aldehyde dehydrogenase
LIQTHGQHRIVEQTDTVAVMSLEDQHPAERESGKGRELGKFGIEEYLETKSLQL